MPPFSPFLLIFLMMPFIEIALFARVGAAIGAGGVLLLCFATSGLGIFILQEQGFRNLLAQTRQWQDEDDMLPELFDRLCIVLAGILLILPGFFTDTMGLLLLVPPLRAAGRRWIVGKLFGGAQFVRTARTRWESEHTTIRGNAIDVEYERVDEDDK